MNSVNRKPFPWTAAIVSAAIVLIVALVLHSCLRLGRGVKHVADSTLQLGNRIVEVLPEIAEKFKTGTITETFRESLPAVTSTGGDVLELAVSRAEETFTRSDKRTVAWDLVNLGTTVAEIKVPVTYRYHLRLSDSWLLASRSNVCLVLAPPIRPSLPPAIDTSRMEKRAESGWARFDKNEKLDELERSLTPALEQRATDPAHLGIVREACRKSVADYVKRWLLQEDHWRKDRFSSVVVVFPDEQKDASAQELALSEREPVMRLEQGEGRAPLGP